MTELEVGLVRRDERVTILNAIFEEVPVEGCQLLPMGFLE